MDKTNMATLRLKLLGSFTILYTILVNAGWFFPVFYLLPLRSAQQTLFAKQALGVWFITYLIALLVIQKPITRLQATVTSLQLNRDVPDDQILSALRYSVTLPKVGFFVYMLAWASANILIYSIWRYSGLGAISAASVFNAFIPGVVACSLMFSSTCVVLTVKVNELLTLTLEQRQLTSSVSTPGIRFKVYFAIGGIAIGLTAWLVGFSYYAMLKKTVEETKATSLAFHSLFLSHLDYSQHNQNFVLSRMQALVQNSTFEESGFVFLADRQGNILALPEGRQLFGKGRETLRQMLRNDFQDFTQNAVYDAMDERIITYTPLHDRALLGTVTYLSDKLPAANFWGWVAFYISPAFLVIIILGHALSTTILHSVNVIFNAVSNLAQGILFVRSGASNLDETGRLVLKINQFLNELTDIIQNEIQIAHEVSSSSKHVRKIAEQVAQGANEQASSAEEVSTSMEQMSATINANSDNTKQANALAQHAAAQISVVSEAVCETKQAMHNIVEQISVIRQFAAKTNLLALNASVEAARTDAGKGFAVIAGEIKALAKHSLNAAQTIEKISQTSLAKAEHSGELLERIIPDIMATSDHVQEVTASSIEQTSGINQVNQALQQLALVTQGNSSSAEEMARNSEKLAEQARLLLDTTAFFKTSQEAISELSEAELEAQLDEVLQHVQILQTTLARRRKSVSRLHQEDIPPKEKNFTEEDDYERYFEPQPSNGNYAEYDILSN